MLCKLVLFINGPTVYKLTVWHISSWPALIVVLCDISIMQYKHKVSCLSELPSTPSILRKHNNNLLG